MEHIRAVVGLQCCSSLTEPKHRGGVESAMKRHMKLCVSRSNGKLFAEDKIP